MTASKTTSALATGNPIPVRQWSLSRHRRGKGQKARIRAVDERSRPVCLRVRGLCCSTLCQAAFSTRVDACQERLDQVSWPQARRATPLAHPRTSTKRPRHPAGYRMPPHHSDTVRLHFTLYLQISDVHLTVKIRMIQLDPCLAGAESVVRICVRWIILMVP